jgi:DNA-binding HxlR family transcriptional regulator
MQRTSLEEMSCPVARALACVGEWWSLLILRDAFQGLTRFEDFRESLGISTNILTRRLHHLTHNDILERRLYRQRPARYDYVLTQKGRDLLPLLLVLYRWGNTYQAPEGIAVELVDRATRRRLDPLVVDRRGKTEITLDRVRFKPGPAARADILARAELIGSRRAETAPISPGSPHPGRQQPSRQQPSRQQTTSSASKPQAHQPQSGKTSGTTSQRKRSAS